MCVQLKSDFETACKDIEYNIPQTDLHKELIKRSVETIHNEFEAKIIRGLADKGFKFETQAELEAFAQQRCSLYIYPCDKRVLCVDGEELLSWFDSYNVEEVRGKIIVTFGRE